MANPLIKIVQGRHEVRFTIERPARSSTVVLQTPNGAATARELSRAINAILEEARCDG